MLLFRVRVFCSKSYLTITGAARFYARLRAAHFLFFVGANRVRPPWMHSRENLNRNGKVGQQLYRLWVLPRVLGNSLTRGGVFRGLPLNGSFGTFLNIKKSIYSARALRGRCGRTQCAPTLGKRNHCGMRGEKNINILINIGRFRRPDAP